jgi:hypothetical protein
MWQTNTNWFEISIVTFFFLVGNIFLGHFEERSPRLKKLIKYFITLAIVILASIYLGRTIALLILGLTLLPIAYIHGIVLPRKGINGWTGEPRSKYYDFRGWDKNIFKDK